MHYEKFSDGSIRCIETEIPYTEPNGWCWCKIDTIAFVTKLAGFEYTKYIAPNLCEKGIPLFKGKNVQNGEIVYEFESFIPERISDELIRSQINRKCILTPYVGTIGNIGIHDRIEKFHLGSNVGKIEIYNKNEILLEEYVVAYLRSTFGAKELTKHMKATAQASISIEAIRDVYIPIPPSNEQQRLVCKLHEILNSIDGIDDDVASVKQLIEKAKSSILNLAIRGKLVPQDPDDEPATMLLERIRCEKKELIKAGKLKKDKRESVIFRGEDNSYYETIGSKTVNIKDELPYNIPSTWTWVRLGTIGNWGAGATPNRAHSEYYGGGIPWLKTGDLNDDYITEIPETITELALKETSVKLNPVGSILIAMYGATIGKLGILTKPATTNQACCACCPVEGVYNKYLFYFLMSHKSKFINCGIGGAQPNISKEKIVATLMPLPPINEQKAIVARIEKLGFLLNSINADMA